MEPFKPMRSMHPMKFGQATRWWPEKLGVPNSTGSQNDIQYAYFGDARRLLLLEDGKITTYDTGDHDIRGVSQASHTAHAEFESNQGRVDLSQLKRL